MRRLTVITLLAGLLYAAAWWVTPAPTTAAAEPAPAVVVAPELAACYPNIYWVMGEPRGGSTFCLEGYFRVRVGCHTRSSSRIVAIVDGPRRHNYMSLVTCPSFAPLSSWASTVLG